jgi:DNA polymerase III epsilon subunit-like protein
MAADLVGAPTFTEVIEEVRTLLESAIVGGHYISSFDMPALVQECHRYGIAPPCVDVFDIRVLMNKVRMKFASKKLTDVATDLGVRITAPAHRAEPDAIVAASILAEIIARIGTERFLMPESTASRFLRSMRRSIRQLR